MLKTILFLYMDLFLLEKYMQPVWKSFSLYYFQYIGSQSWFYRMSCLSHPWAWQLFHTEACICWDVPWQLPCSGAPQNRSTVHTSYPRNTVLQAVRTVFNNDGCQGRQNEMRSHCNLNLNVANLLHWTIFVQHYPRALLIPFWVLLNSLSDKWHLPYDHALR